MRRGEIGSYRVTKIGGEIIRAFVPVPLPPKPALRLDGPLQQRLESSLLALGRLDSIATLMPDKALFLYAYVRKEAVLSSQIEGTQSSMSDFLLFELDEALGAPLDDVREVSNYVAALEHGLRRLAEGFPLSNRLIREIHGVLLSRGRGQHQNARGISTVTELDRWNPSRKCRIRTASAHRGARLHDGVRAFPSRRK